MTGLLLVNLGTPDSPETKEVRRYLRQFLSDPRVIDINAFSRWLLLHLIILPFRPKKSAHAYRLIWTERGSPLLFHSQDLVRAVAERLGSDYKVALGMRYGNPSIASALSEFAGAERIVALPLDPQFSASATQSSVEEIERAAKALGIGPPKILPAFFDDPRFIAAFAARGQEAARTSDYVLFSFHGVPERHIRRDDPSGLHCLASPDCCDRLGDANRSCYRAQCYATARAIATTLALVDGKWSVAFQSRLGRTRWIEPYTDRTLVELATRGVKKIAVFCPAFVADCLETLEEIGLRGRDAFLAAGGESLTLVPSLNAEPAWADAVAELARRA